jgi:Fur family transcriptional regulator, ferric uptake regulator
MRASASPSSTAVEQILTSLRARGGRVTPRRRAIVEVLAQHSERHVDADELIYEIRARLPEVAPSTIYRTLNALEEIGVISHIHLGHGPATFHLSSADHRHLVCTSCEAVIAIPADLVRGLVDEVRHEYGFSIQEEHFAMTGQCEACRRIAVGNPGR